MKYLIYLFVLFTTQMAFTQNLYPNLDDQSGGITIGYGTWGNYNYIRENSVVIEGKGTITFYHPNISTVQKPTVFFINGWGQTYTKYDKLLKYVASLGYPVVDIYNTNPGNIQESYANSLYMIQHAANLYNNWIDTSKVGLMGHSYGAGSTVWLGNELFGTANWGTDGRFIMMFAPWFSLLVNNELLQNYPDNVKMLVLQSYDDFAISGDATYNTDPRATRAVYQLINISTADKDFITVKTDPTHSYQFNGTTYNYEANHYISYTGINSDGVYYPYDLLDVYSSNRLVHAMTDLVFEGNVNAHNVALGNGNNAQIDMGILTDLESTDFYITQRPESDFNYKCSEGWLDFQDNSQVWLLQDYCEDADNDGVIDVLRVAENEINTYNIYPNPGKDYLTIEFTKDQNSMHHISIFNEIGEMVYEYKMIDNGLIDISKLAKGLYILKITDENINSSFQKFIVE